MNRTICRALLLVVLAATVNASDAQGAWRDSSNRADLKNSTLEAKFQGGLLYELKDSAGKLLVSVDPQNLPSQMLIFDTTPTDLDACEVTTKASSSSVVTQYVLPDGKQWSLKWSVDAGSDDLVLQATSRTSTPVEQIRYQLFGCDITDHALVWIDAGGTSNALHAPCTNVLIGDSQKDSTPLGYPAPPVALFEGDGTGWFIEGRDPRTGPANIMLKGRGNTVDIGMVRRFPIAVQSPELFEIRIRAYKKHWEDAVDPYIDWLEKGAGFIPIDKLPKEQAWVRDLETQSYITVGDFENLEALAKVVDPNRTFVGRQTEFRFHSFDTGVPDYRLTDLAKKWVKRARELGFHVGLHYNSNAVSTEFPDLVEKFKPGFAITGKDANGHDTYESLYNGKFIRVSPALKPWREFLIGQIKDAVDAGVDVLYLDESMTAVGKFMIDGVNGLEGMTLLMKEILEAFPHCAVQNEQFNLLTARYGKLALSQMPLGHPLSGYLFRPYVKVVPEGVMYSPTDADLMDAFDYWGFMLPGASPQPTETWPQIAAAYHKYSLQPDSRLPRKQFMHFTGHWTGGIVPVDEEPIPPEGEKLFGLRGSNGVTAYFEKHPTRRGLVVYEPGKEPHWIGTRHFNIKSWKGPGVPAFVGFRQYIRDWLIYDDTSLHGLDPKTTYIFDETIERSPTRFHVTKVPEDFVGYMDINRRIAPQEVGTDESFYRLVFAGHGEMSIYVPDEYDVYLDGKKLPVDRPTKTASATIDASLPKTGGLGYFIALTPEGKPDDSKKGGRASMLLAFKRIDTELAGKWAKLPWQKSKDPAKLAVTSGNDLHQTVGAFAIYIGKLPQAKSIHLAGSYIVNSTTGAPGDGVVLINGNQVLRVPTGDYPYKKQEFSADISSYAGQYVLMEVLADNDVRGAASDWFEPRIVVGK